MPAFSLVIRDANLGGGRAAAEPLIRQELTELRPAAIRLEAALATYALIAENVWDDHELGARTYLAAAGAMLAVGEGVPRIETVNLLIAAVDEFEKVGDRGMALPLASLAHRIAEQTGRPELVTAAREKLASLGR